MYSHLFGIIAGHAYYKALAWALLGAIFKSHKISKGSKSNKFSIVATNLFDYRERNSFNKCYKKKDLFKTERL